MYVVVLQASSSGRIDGNMLTQILGMASTGKPVLICCNQMSRFLDWWTDSAQVDKACEDLRTSVVEAAQERGLRCGPITVYLTELTKYDALKADMEKRKIKTTEHVSITMCLHVQNGHSLRRHHTALFALLHWRFAVTSREHVLIVQQADSLC